MRRSRIARARSATSRSSSLSISDRSTMKPLLQAAGQVAAADHHRSAAEGVGRQL
jgi:hypothetical protein